MTRILFAVLIALVFASPAMAQSTTQKSAQKPTQQTALKPFPKAEKLTKEHFEAQTVLKRIEFPEQDDFFKAEIRLPRNWTPRTQEQVKSLQTTNRMYGNLVWYDAPGEGTARPYFAIRSIALDHEITAKSWLVGYMFENAYNLRSLREYSFTDVEATYVTYDKLVTYVTWARATVLGPRVILAEYHVPSDIWMRDKDWQVRSMESYKLDGKDETRIEQLRAFAFLDVATFQYPQSWVLFRNIIRSPDYFRVALFNTSDTNPNTQITVQATRIGGGTDTVMMKDEEQKFLDKQGYYLRKSLPAPNFVPPKPTIQNLRNLVYTVSAKPRNYQSAEDERLRQSREYWITTFDSGATSYVVSMVVPARDSIYQDWARGTRAYQMVVETLAGNLIGKVNNEKTLKNETAIPFVR